MIEIKICNNSFIITSKDDHYFYGYRKGQSLLIKWDNKFGCAFVDDYNMKCLPDNFNIYKKDIIKLGIQKIAKRIKGNEMELEKTVNNNILGMLGYECLYKVDVLDIDENQVLGIIHLPSERLRNNVTIPMEVYWNTSDLICRSVIDNSQIASEIHNTDLIEKLDGKLKQPKEDDEMKEYMVFNERGSKPKEIHTDLNRAKTEAIRISKQPNNINGKIYVLEINSIYKSRVEVDKIK